ATCPRAGLAVASEGEAFYVLHERPNHEGGCPLEEGETPGPPLVEKLNGGGRPVSAILGHEQTTGAAVELSRGTVYFANVGSAAAVTSTGALIQRFGSGALGQDAGIAVDGKDEAVFVANAGNDTVDIFTPEPSGPPSVDGLVSQNVTPTSTELEAQINPNGADTHYYFQYGTVNCAENPSSCKDAPASCPTACEPRIITPPGPDIGAGVVDQRETVQLLSLQSSTTYYYRVLAENAHGKGEGAETASTFTTLPSASAVLPDHRSWELVSPADKHGAGIEPMALEGGLIQASEEGNALTYIADGPVVSEPEGNRSPEVTQLLSARGPSGWATQDIVTPHAAGEGFVPKLEPPEYRLFSTDLSLGLVQPDLNEREPLEEPPLAPEATEKTIYRRNDATCEATPATCYQPLVTPANDPAHSNFGTHLTFLNATPDLTHVVFGSSVPLTTAPGLYEWSPEQPLALVSVLPGGAPAPEPSLGDENTNTRNAISSNGARVFWTSETEPHGERINHLYMRDVAKAETVQLDAAVPPATEPLEEESEVGFQTANTGGTRVFFTDTAPLTSESGQEPVPGASFNPADLYECEITEEAGHDACKLKDLTPVPLGVSADVLNVIPGASDDGSVLYFVANGVLAPGATPGTCAHLSPPSETAPPGATCNLYVWDNGVITFIAALSNADSGDWGSLSGLAGAGGGLESRPDLADVTSRVSPNGQFLAFMSDRSLTGYNNIDANSGMPDEEVFLYDLARNRLFCASCNPTGRRPAGVLDTENAGEGQGLVVDRRKDWAGSWLAGSVPGWTPLGFFTALHQARYLSNSGRLFFNSPDDLVPGATNGKEDVYEYEPHGVPSGEEGECLSETGCVALISSGISPHESAFLDASASGNDAFFLTSQQLVPADTDSNYDAYDARVCGTPQSLPCLPPPKVPPRPCESSGTCNPTPPQESTASGPTGTATFSGPGNTSKTLGSFGTLPSTTTKPTTQTQKLASALRACRKLIKRKRAACEARARRKYRPSKSSASRSRRQS
ncbi:MAG TPA: hypothetical protein VKG38_10850, partial [Solirubrobacteraceae bacterium]|nr:hypothetical protein [Solirubrobacteraceae bacterium]